MKVNPISFKGTFHIKRKDYGEDAKEILSLENMKRMLPEGTLCRSVARWVSGNECDMDVFVETDVLASKDKSVNVKDLDYKLKVALFEEGIPFEYSPTGRKGTFTKGVL